MSRSRINGNFIDKTFSIVANILLRIIPTTSGEREAFAYYRDGAIWLFSFLFSYLFSLYFLPLLVFLGERRIIIRDIKKIIIEKNLRLLKVKFVNKTNPSVVYPRLMQPQMLHLSILEYWAKGYTYGLRSTLLH